MATWARGRAGDVFGSVIMKKTNRKNGAEVRVPSSSASGGRYHRITQARRAICAR